MVPAARPTCLRINIVFKCRLRHRFVPHRNALLAGRIWAPTVHRVCTCPQLWPEVCTCMCTHKCHPSITKPTNPQTRLGKESTCTCDNACLLGVEEQPAVSTTGYCIRVGDRTRTALWTEKIFCAQTRILMHLSPTPNTLFLNALFAFIY